MREQWWEIRTRSWAGPYGREILTHSWAGPCWAGDTHPQLGGKPEGGRYGNTHTQLGGAMLVGTLSWVGLCWAGPCQERHKGRARVGGSCRYMYSPTVGRDLVVIDGLVHADVVGDRDVDTALALPLRVDLQRRVVMVTMLQYRLPLVDPESRALTHQGKHLSEQNCHFHHVHQTEISLNSYQLTIHSLNQPTTHQLPTLHN